MRERDIPDELRRFEENALRPVDAVEDISRPASEADDVPTEPPSAAPIPPSPDEARHARWWGALHHSASRAVSMAASTVADPRRGSTALMS